MNKQLLFGCIAALAASVVSAATPVESWEAGGRAETLKWFEDNQFGKTPIGRPADERIGDRSVEFADSGIKIKVRWGLSPCGDKLLILTRMSHYRAGGSLGRSDGTIHEVKPKRGDFFENV